MPFKEKIIKEMQKCISQFSDAYSPQNSIQIDQGRKIDKNNQNKHIKAILRKRKNIYELFLRKIPAQSVHVANFFNIMGINQEAIRSDDFQQSYCRTAFYLRSIKKAEVRANCIVFHLSQSNYCFSPIQYSIQRFKSLGDTKFFNMAVQMEGVISKLNELKNHVENNDNLDKYIESLRNKMFVIRTSSKFIISKAFLEILQYDPEEYTIQAVKYRSSIYEGCSTKNYYEVMMKTLENIKILIDLLFDRISLETFLDNSIMRFKDYLYTKNNKKIFAKVKTGMPNPFVTIFQIEEVISISEQFPTKNYFKGEKRQQLNLVKQDSYDSDIKSIRHLIKLPPSYLPQNQHKVSKYIELSEGYNEENIKSSS